MSCNYFILTKPKQMLITDDNENQIIDINKKSNIFILPRNNINYYINNGLFEKHLIGWCKQFCSKDKIFLDMGAHSGTYTISLANYSNHVYAFEPQKMTYYSLCGSVALSNLDNITCLNFGLGSIEQVGNQVLNIVSDDGGGSSLHLNNNTILKTEIIEIKTLDSLNLKNIGFIKMDVEENELFILKGGLETLKISDYPKILFESNNVNSDLFIFIQNIGYKITQITNSHNMFLACKNM